MSGVCRVCEEAAKQVCGRCKAAWYCGKPHQTEDWKKRHKAECKPTCRVQRSDRLGRYLVAGRPIRAGEVVLREKPLVVGPKMNCEPLCLGCHAELEPPADAGDYRRCEACGWPLCSAPCGKSQHHEAECAVMAANGFRCPVTYSGGRKREAAYCVVTPLRCLLLEEPGLRALLDLESHVAVRSESALYRVLRTNLVPFVRDALRLPFSEDAIMKVAAVLDTNCFAVSRPGVKIRGLYKEAAMMAHDCRPNTKHYFTESLEIVLVATVDIAEGAAVTASYSQSLWGTEARREQLLASKCFYCTCVRCADHAELGTFLGALWCPRCGEDYVVSRRPLEASSLWSCRSCLYDLTAQRVCDLHVDLQQRVQALDKSTPRPMEDFISHHLSETPFVHKNMYQIIQVKHGLCQKYGRMLPDLSDKQLEYRLSLITDLLEVANILEPGLTRLRGQLLYDLQETKFLLINRNLRSGSTNQVKIQEGLQKIQAILNEASDILKTEPDLYPSVQIQMENIKKVSLANNGRVI